MPKSYKRDRPDGHYDYIIVGSGLSGSALAAMLARAGKRCLVLERHYTAGGFTQVFRRREYEWDVGVHYVGEVHRHGSMMERLFRYVTDGALEWADLGEVYDRIFFGEQAYDFVRGTEAFRSQLKEYFPDPADQEAIDTYLSLIRTAQHSARGLFMGRAMPGVMGRLIASLMDRNGRRFARRTTREVLEELTGNEALIGVLTGQYGDYGLPPGQSSFLMHAVLARHYLHGGSYPVGGSARIFDTIEPVITAAGGEVFVGAEVERILIDNGRAVGVRMADGTELRAPFVVSSTGVHHTFSRLLAGCAEVASLRESMVNLSSSAAHLCLYIGLRHTAAELNLPKTNFWIYPPHYNHDENLSRYLADPDNAPFPLVYLSFPAAKDPDFENRYPGRSTIEAITLGDYRQFAVWENTRWHKRGQDYEAYKEQITQRLLDTIYRYLPQLRGKVDYYELSTPLTTRHFVNYAHGEIYGLAHTPDRFLNRDLNVATPIKNFFLTGQDLTSCGLGGALSAAMMTASVLLRKNMATEIRRATEE